MKFTVFLLVTLYLTCALQVSRKQENQSKHAIKHGQHVAATTKLAKDEEDSKSTPDCLPTCTWQCSNPSCPAECEPECAKPDCEVTCKPVKAPKCEVVCSKPQCQIRCSNRDCGDEGCPVCENVCLEPVCKSKCDLEEPECAPKCPKPDCKWNCRKPLTCPRPKCSMVCEKKECGAKTSKCCSCDTKKSIAKATSLASIHSEIKAHHMPTFIEIAHESQFMQDQQCCPCDDE